MHQYIQAAVGYASRCYVDLLKFLGGGGGGGSVMGQWGNTTANVAAQMQSASAGHCAMVFNGMHAIWPAWLLVLAGRRSC